MASANDAQDPAVRDETLRQIAVRQAQAGAPDAAIRSAQGIASAEVGMDEKLGAAVALDATLKDEEGMDIALRQLIDKPTILVFNYFLGSVLP
jgi:cytochrome oxidase Cu insertion factor (SCO1/SenC/PrrC family)